MWSQLLDQTLRSYVRTGALEVTFPDGAQRRYGAAGVAPVRIALTDPRLPARLLRSPELALGEAYMAGTLTIEGDDLHGLFSLLLANRRAGRPPAALRLNLAIRWLRRSLDQFNPAGRARRRVAHHYDLNSRLYELFLDADRQYSCAYFRRPSDSLETAQAQKKALIARKLQLSPGMEVLDIGCGWGGLALTLAQEYGVRVTGITLSTEQLAVARARAEAAGLANRVQFHLTDYRAVEGRFDRVVSVGMFEHVGAQHYRAYFEGVARRLAPDGVALIHTIGRSGAPGTNSPWIERYIFPGGYVPALSEVAPRIEQAGLIACDVEVWRLHYAHTLRHWFDRFSAQAEAAARLYDARFVRMWRYYLAASEMTFRSGDQVVFQFQIAHRQDAVPLTRDYLAAEDSPRNRVAAE